MLISSAILSKIEYYLAPSDIAIFLLSDSPDDVQIIESKTSAVSIPLIQNYKEEHIPNIFYELGLEFSLNHQVKLIIKKHGKNSEIKSRINT